jgi:hypothetical protein
VQARDGVQNWMLLEPDADAPALFKAGSQGLPEMREWLEPTRVLYGLLRMSFGAGQFKRCKCAPASSCGACSAVQCGGHPRGPAAAGSGR